MSYSKDYSKCAKCGSVKDINCIWFEGEYFSICYDCLVELLKNETDLQVDELDGETIFVNDDVRAKDLTSYLCAIENEGYDNIGFDDVLCWDCNGATKKYFIIYDQEEKEDVTICPTCLAKRMGLDVSCNKNYRHTVLHDGKVVSKESEVLSFESWIKYNDDIINYCIDNLGLKVEQLPIEYTDNMKLIYEGEYIPPIFFKVIG